MVDHDDEPHATEFDEAIHALRRHAVQYASEPVLEHVEVLMSDRLARIEVLSGRSLSERQRTEVVASLVKAIRSEMVGAAEFRATEKRKEAQAARETEEMMRKWGWTEAAVFRSRRG